jgi:hypothetical protein
MQDLGPMYILAGPSIRPFLGQSKCINQLFLKKKMLKPILPGPFIYYFRPMRNGPGP